MTSVPPAVGCEALKPKAHGAEAKIEKKIARTSRKLQPQKYFEAVSLCRISVFWTRIFLLEKVSVQLPVSNFQSDWALGLIGYASTVWNNRKCKKNVCALGCCCMLLCCVVFSGMNFQSHQKSSPTSIQPNKNADKNRSELVSSIPNHWHPKHYVPMNL